MKKSYLNPSSLLGVFKRIRIAWLNSDFYVSRNNFEKIIFWTKFTITVISQLAGMNLPELYKETKWYGKIISVKLDNFGRYLKRLSSKTKAIVATTICVICLAAILNTTIFAYIAIRIWSSKSVSKKIANEEVKNSETPTLPTPQPTILPIKINPKSAKESLGLSRVKAKDEDLVKREQEYIQTQSFNVLKTDPQREAPDRIMEYRSLIEESANAVGLDPNLLEALLLTENQGKSTGASPTGPCGIAMFSKARAREVGLVIEDGRDDRYNPELAIPAAARALKDSYDTYGDWQFAVVEYHMGRGALTKLIMMYIAPKQIEGTVKQALQKYNIHYRDIFFRNTPYHNGGTYQMIKTLTQKDWSPRYWFKVACWKNLMTLYRTNKDQFITLSKQQFYKGKAQKSRMWSFFNQHNDPAFKDMDDLKNKVKDGTLVPIPKGDKYGYTVRPLGSSDPNVSDRKYYHYAYKYTTGMLLYVATALQELRNSKSKQAVSFDISSYTRTIWYQNQITKTNRFATKDKSWHYYGLAFDIPYSSLTADEKSDIEFVLTDLESAGMISWVRENNNCYHVVVAPTEEAREFFSDFYSNQISSKAEDDDASADELEKTSPEQSNSDPPLGQNNQ